MDRFVASRRQREINTEVGGKPREQRYFKGIFPEAGYASDDEDEDDSERLEKCFAFYFSREDVQCIKYSQ